MRWHPARPWRAQHVVRTGLRPVAHREPTIIEHKSRSAKRIGRRAADDRGVAVDRVYSRGGVIITRCHPRAATHDEVAFLGRFQLEVQIRHRIGIGVGVNRHLDRIGTHREITRIDAELLAQAIRRQARAGTHRGE